MITFQNTENTVDVRIWALDQTSVEECWNKSLKIVAAFVALFFVEHVVLCVPIFYLKFCIDMRNADLPLFFDLLPEENKSTENVNILGWTTNFHTLREHINLFN